MPKAYAFYDMEKRVTRVKTIREKATKWKLSPVVVTKADFIDALAAVMAAKEDNPKNPPALIGFMKDLHPPEGTEVSEDIWIECIICFLEKEGISYYPLDIKVGKRLDLESNVIRKYHQAFTILTETLRIRLNSNGKKFGRPPYGYCMIDGVLEVDKQKADAVKLIFKRLREEAEPREILEELRKKFPRLKGVRKKQFWDHVKLRRIVEKARLYCLGEYHASDGAKMTIERLAFLPPEWADTEWPNHQGVAS